jgi:hypothetical protein
MTKNDVLLELSQELYNSDANKIPIRLESLSLNFYIFSRNYQEIKNFYEYVLSDDQKLRLSNLSNRNELHGAIYELARLLHNYLASASSLVDHTRVMISFWYKDTDFYHEYKSQVTSRFSKNPLTAFIEGLRNYSLHYSLPISTAVFLIKMVENDKGGSLECIFVLKKSILSDWDSWDLKGKTFLNAADEEINIYHLVENYYQLIFDFHSWLYKRLRKIHSKELLWVSKMRKRIFDAMSDEERQARGFNNIDF